MNTYVKHIVITLLTTLAILSCKKNEPTLTGEPILISAMEAGSTKALLDATTFETPGNQIKIYDYYSEGSIAEGYYIDDEIKCVTKGNWPFVKESHK